MNNPFTLIGKTILVTGASAGIGRGIAVACAGMGARVILTARNTERLQETLSQLEGDGHTYIKDENGNPATSDNTVKSAIPGLILTVINDEDTNNNGMYYIENTDPNATPGLSAAKINITGPIPNAQIDLLFTAEEQGTPEEQ